MKGFKLILCIVCAVSAIIAIVAAVAVFRNEISCCCSGLKDKINNKVLRRNGEYSDYADI